MNTHAPVQQRQHDAPAPLLGGARKQRPAANVGLPLFMQADSGASAVGATLQRQCACAGTSGANDECETCNSGKRLQAKLTIGASDDPLEQEADRVAEQVLAAPSQSDDASAAPRIQRFAEPTGVATDAEAAPTSVDRVLARSGRPLEPALQHDMAQRFGHDFSQVRVHTDDAAEQSAREISAHAYTVGHNIVFGPGRYAPETHAGQRLLAHELAHVVQQGGATGGTLQRQPAPGPTFAEPEQCSGKRDITLQFNQFVRDVPALILTLSQLKQEQRDGLTSMAKHVFNPEGAANLSKYKVVCCSGISLALVMAGGESVQAYIDPAHTELGLSVRTFNLMDAFRTTLNQETLSEFLQIIAHEKRHVTLGSAIQVNPSDLRPGRSDSAARNAAYRAEEVLATAEEIAVGRMALGSEYLVPENLQQKLRRSRNMIRGWVTEAEDQRLQALILRQLRDRYGFNDGCDTSLTVGVVRSMERGEWFSCDYETGGIYGPVPAGVTICTDPRHRFCTRKK